MESTPPPARSDRSRPLLRGWFHAAAAIAAIVVTVLLLIDTSGAGRWTVMLIFGLSMIVLYGVSATYHIITWGPRTYRVLKSIDHANIFILIAGTYTPFCAVLLDGALRVVMLSLLWGLALTGIILKVTWRDIPRWLSVSFYIGMGWVGMIAAPRLFSVLPWGGVALVVTGGLLYTLGGVVYALRRPNPLPRIFGFHEIFHLLGIAAHVAFVVAVWIWVVPYGQA